MKVCLEQNISIVSSTMLISILMNSIIFYEQLRELI